MQPYSHPLFGRVWHRIESMKSNLKHTWRLEAHSVSPMSTSTSYRIIAACLAHADDSQRGNAAFRVHTASMMRKWWESKESDPLGFALLLSHRDDKTKTLGTTDEESVNWQEWNASFQALAALVIAKWCESTQRADGAVFVDNLQATAQWTAITELRSVAMVPRTWN